MLPIAKYIVNACWGIFFIVWLLAAIFTKRTVYRESAGQRLRYMLPIVVGWLLLFRGYRLPPPLGSPLIPRTDVILFVVVLLSICGVSFCVWARFVLGRNWSGTVTLKEDHELIVRGPYRLVRHPIYTGLLTLILGTAILTGHVAGLIAVAVVAASFWIKLQSEEEVMRKQFPGQYSAYEHRVKRIIPFVL